MKNIIELIVFGLRLKPFDITSSLYQVISPTHRKRLKVMAAAMKAISKCGVSLDEFSKACVLFSRTARRFGNSLSILQDRDLREQWNIYQNVLNSPQWR